MPRTMQSVEAELGVVQTNLDAALTQRNIIRSQFAAVSPGTAEYSHLQGLFTSYEDDVKSFRAKEVALINERTRLTPIPVPAGMCFKLQSFVK